MEDKLTNCIECELFKTHNLSIICSDHICTVKFCKSKREQNSDRCIKCKCENTICTNSKRIRYRKYCIDCKCKNDKCEFIKEEKFKYCQYHKCMNVSCSAPKIKEFGLYCIDCKCKNDECEYGEKESGFSYCDDCKCENNLCDNKKEIYIYCNKCMVNYKCKSIECNKPKFFEFDFCSDCKCSAEYCNNQTKNIYCDKCTCSECRGHKFPNDSICEDCESAMIRNKKCCTELSNILQYESSMNYLCNAIEGCWTELTPDKSFCKYHKCCIIGCNEKNNAKTRLCTKFNEPYKRVCDIHAIWTHDNHIKYPKSFQDEIMTLLLILKRNECNLKIPKFVKYEIFKRSLIIFLPYIQ